MDSPLQNLVISTTRKSNNVDDDTGQIEEIEQVASFRTYKTRFYGLTVIAFLNISSSLNWYIVAPVPDLASTYFDNIGFSAINWFSNVFMLAYLIAGPISSWVYDHLSVKFGIIVGAFLQVIGVWLRYTATFIDDDPAGKFALAIVGQTICAAGQPFILNACLPYVAVWFSAEGRASASMVGGVANALGMAAASIVVPLMVADSTMIPFGFLIIACVTTGVAVFVFFIPKKPKTPPSFTASSKDKYGLSFTQSLFELAKNWNFLIILVAFSICSGLTSGLSSLLTQIVAPYGIDNTNAGFLAAGFIVAGLVSSIITGIFLDKLGGAIWFIRIFVPITGAAYVSFYFVVPTADFGAIMTVCILMGFTTFSLLPVALDLSVESSYPVSEAISSSLLWMGNQLVGFVVMQVINALRDDDGTYSNGLIFAACIVCPLSILSTIYNSPNRRAEFEKRNRDIYSEE